MGGRRGLSFQGECCREVEEGKIRGLNASSTPSDPELMVGGVSQEDCPLGLWFGHCISALGLL